MVSPEHHLQRALSARTPAARARWARLGLATRAALDRTTQAMLLRQLYLAHYEERRFRKARAVAEQMVALGVLPDVAHQDAARACQATGDLDEAAGHLRLAARKGPASRRAFHLWTLGSLLYLRGRYGEASSILARAARWGTTDRPLYHAHRALARCRQGESVDDLDAVIDRLAEAPCGRGYGRYLLGQLLAVAGRTGEAARHLEAFVRRTTSGRPTLALALAGEVADARATLAALRKK